MSKERLEEIKKAYRYGYGNNPNSYPTWLIERVQELEEIKNDAIKQIDVTQRRNERLEERVQELDELVASYQTELSIKDNANKRIKKQNKCYRETIEKIKYYNRKALKGNYTETEALLDISLEIRKLEGEE